MLNVNGETARHGEVPKVGRSQAPLLARLSRLVDVGVLIDVYYAIELAAVFALGVLAAELYVHNRLGSADYLEVYITYLVLGPLLLGIILQAAGCHRAARLGSYFATLDRLVLSVMLTFLALIAVGFGFGIDDEISRAWLALWATSTLVFLLLSRAVAARALRDLSKSHVVLSTVAVYSDGTPTDGLVAEIRRTRPNTHIVGVFGPSGRAAWDGDLATLLEIGRTQPLDAIVIATSRIDGEAIRDLLLKFSVLPSEVLISLGFGVSHIPIRSVHALEESQLLEVQRKPISGWGRLLKMVLDYTIASIAVVALAPVLALVALAIKLDSPGPVLFRQNRHGFNNNVFAIYKFRTMTVLEDGAHAIQARRGDKRVTRVGRFLRRSSLDELPQLFNVLRGEMSIVGPRPHPLALNSEFQNLLTKYENRHVVKPGITGWAQINGYRGPTEDAELMRRRVELDLDYIENWSIWMDLKIIAATPFTLIFTRNAL